MVACLPALRPVRPLRRGLPFACVIGDISLVRALGRRGIPVAVATAEPDSSITRSRYCRAILSMLSVVDDARGAVSSLVAWARRQAEPPVVFYQGDHDLLALSRHRDELTPHVRCLLPPPDLVEDCVDKIRFAALAQRLSLPVPTTCVLRRGTASRRAALDWDRFPCVLKPAMRTHWFGSDVVRRADGGGQKALYIGDRAELERMAAAIDEHETDFVLQDLVAGGENRVLSYHAYVRPGGEIVAEFTGRKLRTTPRRHGVSTYVEITDDPVVKGLGRMVLERLGFHGVLKMDFKQDERDGRIYLLEINPRFNLWHHPATLAGICLPELVYRDCVEPGSARPARGVRAGVRWLSARADRRGLREHIQSGELSFARWLWQFATATVNEDFSLRDPRPGFAELLGMARRRLRGAWKLPDSIQP